MRHNGQVIGKPAEYLVDLSQDTANVDRADGVGDGGILGVLGG